MSTATSIILDTTELLQNVVDLTKDGFGLYHTHIYLFNEVGDTLELAAGSGAVGRQMVSEGWSIPLEEQSLVARTARLRRGEIVNNVREEQNGYPTCYCLTHRQNWPYR